MAKNFLNVLPFSLRLVETQKTTFLMFLIGTLDLLGVLDENLPFPKSEFIDWIYSNQRKPTEDHPFDEKKCYGFTGTDIYNVLNKELSINQPSIVATYCCLYSLVILGDDLSRVDKKSILRSLKHYQMEDGSFRVLPIDSETDVRFAYCACVVSYLLGDFSYFNCDALVEYIRSCHSYDYGIGQSPGTESHGGYVYCSIASLKLMNRLEDGLLDKDATIDWLISRQVAGFQGRVNKLTDSCYSFWIGASLKILGASHFINAPALKQFIFDCQFSYGGIAKTPDVHPDPMHTYLALAGLSLVDDEYVLPVDPLVNISKNRLDEYFSKGIKPPV